VDQESVRATLTVTVPAARVFAVLADPTIHAAIDGTGWVQEPVDRMPFSKVGQISGWACVTPAASSSRPPILNISPTRCTTWPSLPNDLLSRNVRPATWPAAAGRHPSHARRSSRRGCPASVCRQGSLSYKPVQVRRPRSTPDD
jgi:hypothetical protein